MPKIRAVFGLFYSSCVAILFFAMISCLYACQKSPGDLSPAADAAKAVHSISNDAEFQKVMELSHQKLVVIDFYADWCGPCRELAPVLEKIAPKLDQSAQFYKINIDEQRKISIKSGVSGIPYVAFFKQGKKVHTLMGVWPKESYTRAVERFAFPLTSAPQEETPDGEIIDGIRVIHRIPEYKLDEIYVYRGEMVKLIFQKLKSAYAVAIPKYQISIEGHQGEDLEVTFKADKVGVFPVFCNGDCPVGDGMEYGRIVVMPFAGAKEVLYKEVNAAEAKQLIEATEALTLDVRTPKEYYSGHLPGAKLIPLQQLSQRISEIKEYQNKKILVYCRSGNRSIVASEILIQNGFKEIYHLKNGIIEWAEKGYPLLK